jgi:hypothetical protein
MRICSMTIMALAVLGLVASLLLCRCSVGDGGTPT